MPSGKAQAPLGRVVRVLLQIEDPTRGLLLEPLAGVALVDAGGLGQLGGGQRAAVGQRPVETELVAEVHGQEIERLDTAHEELADERVATLVRGKAGASVIVTSFATTGRMRSGPYEVAGRSGTGPRPARPVGDRPAGRVHVRLVARLATTPP